MGIGRRSSGASGPKRASRLPPPCSLLSLTPPTIEDRYPVDVKQSVTLDCQVTQTRWRTASLRALLRSRSLLLPNKELDFNIMPTGSIFPPGGLRASLSGTCSWKPNSPA
ncbi:MAG: hypothetical protein GX446_07875 [Chthonomonadales bacterium]|nr:hypothetical protein [Chthonomonadales bacterium]